jgi:hypothetical protein
LAKQTANRGRSDKQDVYLRALRRHACELLVMGYARLKPFNFADCPDETIINGRLCDAMDEVMRDPRSPDWVERYALKDDNPLNVPGRYGKGRPRIDIEIERVKRPRPRFRFEAKRLQAGTKHTASVYLGEAGLGAFLSGEYPLTHPEAGMIGYVQSDTEDIWASRISNALAATGNKFRVSPGGEWAKENLANNFRHTYRTQHEREGNGPRLTVYHVLLRFF